MKHLKPILILITILFSYSYFAQVSNAKLQWKRNTQGLSYEDETSKKGYRDPATGNIYVMYQGYHNYGITRFDNSGASVANFKQKSRGSDGSFAGDFKYIGNSQLVTCGTKWPNGDIMKITSDGDSIWEYIDYSVTAAYSSTPIFPNQSFKSITKLANGSIVAGGTNTDTTYLISLTTNGTLNWRKKYIPANYDKGIILGLQTDNFNNIYTCGTIRNSAGNFDAFVTAFNQNGNILWERFIVGAAGANDSATKILIDNSGNVFVGGIIKDSSATNNSTFVVKYNASGGLQYMKKFHQAGQVDASLGAINFDAAGNLAFVSNSFTDADHASVYTQRYNAFGVLQWTNVYANTTYFFLTRNTAVSAVFDPFGNIYFSGTLGLSNSSLADEFVVKINSTGNMVWDELYDNPSNTEDHSVDLLIDNSGNTYNIGYTGRFLYKPINTTIVKYSSTGLMQWEGLFDSPGNKQDNGIELAVEGSSSIYSFGTTTNEGTDQDIVLNKFNSQGDLLWQVTYDNGNGFDAARTMIVDSQKHIHLLMSTTGVPTGSFLLTYDTTGTLLSSSNYPEYYRGMSMDANENLYLSGNPIGAAFSNAEYVVRKVDLSGNSIYQSGPLAGDREFFTSFSKVNESGELYVFGLQSKSGPTEAYLTIAKYSTAGTLDWSMDIPGYDSTSYQNMGPNDMTIDTNGNVIILGSAKYVSESSQHGLILKISPAGNVIWRNDFATASSNNMLMKDLELDSYGTLWVSDQSANLYKFDQSTGNLLNTSQIGTLGSFAAGTVRRYGVNEVLVTSGGFYNYRMAMFLHKVDTLGNMIWSKEYANINFMNIEVSDVRFDSNGRIYLLGSSAEGEGGFGDIILLKYCDLPVPSISSSGPYQNICPGNPVTLTAGAGDSYLWNPSNTTQQTFTTDTTADVYAFVYQSDGCYQSTDTLNVTQRPAPITPDICLVTVDSLSTHNIIIWDKAGLSLVDHFNIYREDVATLYNLIALVPFDSLSEYHDYATDPNVTTKRYKISSVDSCGVESAMSKYHNTIYVTSSGNGQYNWNLYLIEPATNPVTNFLLMRDDNATGAWHQVGSTAGTQQTLNDPAYASFPNADWRVETSWGISCESTFRLPEQNSIQGIIVKSKSNIKTNRMIGLKPDNIINEFLMFPNPANEQVQIKIPANKNGSTIEVYNTLGQKVLGKTTQALETSVDVTLLQAGTYFVKVKNENGSSTKKLIKN